MTNVISIKAYAKLNLFLDITGVLSNGYHTLNTVMQSINLADDLTISVCGADKTEITVSADNPCIPTDKRNIAVRAAEHFLNNLGKTARVKIDIKKNIPVEAGLGGSSTDGAAVLTALNRIFGSPYNLEELEKTGEALGADVPFCITGGTRICTGTGVITSELPVSGECAFLIIKPDFSCNTKEAYALYDKAPIPTRNDFKDFSETLKNCGMLKASAKMYNVFERIYEKTLYSDEIKKLRGALLNAGARGAAMTGSGSAFFGVFKNEEEAARACCSVNLQKVMKFVALPVKKG